MSFLDELKDRVISAIGGMQGEHSDLVKSIVEMVANKESGGLAGLVDTFKEKGLGDVISSWIGTGKNIPISAEQIQQGIGKEKIQQFAERIGVDPEAAKSRMAQLLPDIIDKLTPEGKIPEGGLLEKAADLFGKRAA